MIAILKAFIEFLETVIRIGSLLQTALNFVVQSENLISAAKNSSVGLTPS